MAKLVALREASSARRLAQEVLAGRLALDFPKVAGEVSFLPTYTLAPREARKSPRIVRAGWRYFWLAAEGGEGAVVELARTRGKRPQLVGYSKGRWSESVLKCLASARERLRMVNGSFRPRLLTIPPIHCEALWFHDPGRPERDRFFNLVDGRELHGPFKRQP